MYLESMNIPKQKYLIQFLQTFVDLTIARFPLASSFVPQRSGLSNQKAIPRNMPRNQKATKKPKSSIPKN